MNMAPTMSDQTMSDLRPQREAVVDAHTRAEAVDLPAMGGIIEGAANVQRLLEQLFQAFPDFWIEQEAIHHSDHTLIVEARFGGTHRGVWAGIEPTGNQMAVGSALVF